jgi:dienelactone hydrolase
VNVWISRLIRTSLLLSFGLFAAHCVYGQELNSKLNESVLMIPKGSGLFSTTLEVTLHKPDGEGPFPLAVINHGKANGEPRFQARYRHGTAASYFLQRGYAVLIPMRSGFSKSTGNYIGAGCNIGSNGESQAEDVKVTLDYITQQSWADKQRIIVLGQSHGGWTTLAFGTFNYPGVKGLVNFAGGLRQEQCPAWQQSLARATGDYGKRTPLPSLWFYGENDSYFNPFTYKAMHEQYTQAGGQARLVEFGVFGTDAHSMFGSRNGIAIWQPEVSRFLAQLGLPSEPLPIYAKFGSNPVPAAMLKAVAL